MGVDRGGGGSLLVVRPHYLEVLVQYLLRLGESVGVYVCVRENARSRERERERRRKKERDRQIER